MHERDSFGVALSGDSARTPAALESADEVLWTKLAMASMAPMTAIMRRTIKDVVDDPRSFATVRGMFDEAVNVAHALGVRLDREAAWEHSTNTWRLVGHSAKVDVIVGDHGHAATVADTLRPKS